MASSDASTSSGSEYQVFLSFRGLDTRVGLADFLFHSLTDIGISVFRDDEEVCVGERIDGSLQRAIDNSRIYIPIFSRTYASSQWCLRELAQIVANTSKSEGQKKILPIFFDVEPDDVKLKTPLYRDAIFNLEREKKLNNGQVDACKEALMEVDAIKGWEVKKYKGYGDVINLVVEEVVKKLKTKHRLVTEHLVGIDDRVAAVTELLDIDSDDVRLIGIHGMGGIGKTTLAKIVFNQLPSHYGKCCCFLEDVGVKSLRTDGLVELQKKLSSEIGHPAGARSIDEIDYGTKRSGETLSNKKVLIVLDDVANHDQVLKLVGGSTLYPGSRILITTRNKEAMRINRPNYRIIEYEMEVMSHDHALELFSRHAFNRDSPSDDYNDLSRKIVFATGRLPLALEVIGSFLFDKRQQIWKETSEKLSKAPDDDVFGKLKISYDALTYRQQQIFLDIACFFIGEHTTCAIYMWKDCDFFPDTGIDVLISMSLVKIVENTFWMHDQLRDLGREIVHREDPINPGKWSRLWNDKEVLNAIRTKEMKKNVQALNLDLYKSDRKTITSEEIGRFQHLRYLKLEWGTFSGNLAKSLTNLRWIFWHYPPRQLTFKPTNMRLNNVVVLEFSNIAFIDNSKLQSLIQMARKLKVLSLIGCYGIDKTPDFSGCPNLERLNFEICCNLKKLDGSIGKLKSLIDLKIRYCRSLENLPEEIGNLVNLKHFLVEECPVKKLPDSIGKLKSLIDLEIRSCDSLENLPEEIGNLVNLKHFLVEKCSVKKLLDSIGKLKSLIDLKIRNCDSLENLPEEIGNLVNLKHFLVERCPMKKLPDSMWKLKSLCELHFDNVLHFDDEYTTVCSTNSWEIPSAVMLENLEVLRIRSPNLKGQLPPTIGNLPFLRILCLLGTCISEVPETVSMLPCLQTLELTNCNEIQELPILPTSLNTLQVSSTSLQMVPDLSNLTNLISLKLSDGFCGRQGGKICTGDLRGIGKLPKLDTLSLALLDVPAPSELASLSQLKELHLFGLDPRTLTELQSSLLKLTLSSFHLSGLDPRTLQFNRVMDLALHNFNSTVLLSSKLENLSRLALRSSQVQEIQLSGLQLPNLTELFLGGGDCDPLEILGLSNLRKLKTVEVSSCRKLVEIQFAGVLESLQKFTIRRCKSLGRFGYAGEAEFADELITGERGLILLSRVLCMLRWFSLQYCHNILQIQVVGASELWRGFHVQNCRSLQSVGGLSNLKKLVDLSFEDCDRLQVVERFDQPEFLKRLNINSCRSLERLIDVSNTKLPNACHIWIYRERKLCFYGTFRCYKRYKRRRRRRMWTSTCFT